MVFYLELNKSLNNNFSKYNPVFSLVDISIIFSTALSKP
jgi:hypothetical protein